MRVPVPHTRPKAEVQKMLDQPLKVLFSEALDGVEITDEKRVWKNSAMTFSFTGRVGVISLPLSGAMEVEDHAVIVDVELPPVVKVLVGEEKIRAGLVHEIKMLLKRA